MKIIRLYIAAIFLSFTFISSNAWAVTAEQYREVQDIYKPYSVFECGPEEYNDLYYMHQAGRVPYAMMAKASMSEEEWINDLKNHSKSAQEKVYGERAYGGNGTSAIPSRTHTSLVSSASKKTLSGQSSPLQELSRLKQFQPKLKTEIQQIALQDTSKDSYEELISRIKPEHSVPSSAKSIHKKSIEMQLANNEVKEFVPLTKMDRLIYEDIREQTTQELSDDLVIDEKYLESQNIPVPQSTSSARDDKNGLAEDEVAVHTDEDIIRSLITDELKDTRIDLDFDEVSLVDIFHTLGKAADINVMLDPSLKGFQMDLHLKQVSLEEAFILIANAYDLGFKRVKGSLFITQKDKIREQNQVKKIIKLRNISAQVAKDLIEDLIKNINISEEINSIIVEGEPKEVKEIEAIIAKIDVAQPQVILEAQIIELNRDALRELGVDWSDSISINYQESNRPAQFEDTVDNSEQMLNIFAFQRSPLAFNTTIRMLENQNKAKILSNPRITTLNDKEAEIFVGDRIPYTVTNVTGGVATTDVRWVEPGIRLRITPSIIEEDFVVIQVEPEVSFIFAFRGPNDEFPQVKTREATANVRIKNRQPFILGGLLNQEDKKNLYKVPVMGDIPLLGNLFSYDSHTVVDTELIITIIPTIVTGVN
ncbi:MAG: hypothetical protein KC713_07775 [Candidatus Omnitrophica bacterium]|nr:hypothetical protein [Candidatus Omnitrophota bacterium]